MLTEGAKKVEIGDVKIVGRLYRELPDSERTQIVSLLGDAFYRATHEDRLSIIASLSLWLAEAGVKPTSSFLLIKELEEYIKKMREEAASISLADRRRIYGILVGAYRWAGLSLSPYAEEIRKVAGVRLEELEDISAIEIHRRRSLRDVLESLYGEEKAFYIIHELILQLKHLPSTLDLIVVETSVGEFRYHYAIDFKNEAITRVTKIEEVGLMIKADLVSTLIPRKIRLYMTKDRFLQYLLGGSYLPSVDAREKIEVTLMNKSLGIVYNVGPNLLPPALREVANHKLVFRRRAVMLALKGLIDYGLKYGWHRLEVVPLDYGIRYVQSESEAAPKIDFSGIYILWNNLIAVSRFEIREPNVEKLRAALEQLNMLLSLITSSYRNKAAAVIKWAAAAPFSLIRRRFFGLPFRWLYLKGYKSRRELHQKFIFMMWGLDEKRHKRLWPSHSDPAYIMEAHSLSTFPHYFIDPGGYILEGWRAESFIERSVSAVPSSHDVVIRDKILKAPAAAVAPFVISTSRRPLPNPYLAKNFIIVGLYEGLYAKISMADFMNMPILKDPSLMREIGNCVAWHAVRNPELLTIESELQLGLTLLEACYSMAGVEIHKSLRSEYRPPVIDKIYAKNLIRYYLRRLIRAKYTRVLQGTKKELADRLRELLEKNLLESYGIYRLDNERVAVTRAFLKTYFFEGISFEMLAEAIDGSIEKIDKEEAVVTTIDKMANALKKIARRKKKGESA